jgi:hypothetical protein
MYFDLVMWMNKKKLSNKKVDFILSMHGSSLRFRLKWGVQKPVCLAHYYADPNFYYFLNTG